MRIVLALIATVLSVACSGSGGAGLTDKDLVGTWECGPTTMHGPNFDIVVTDRGIKKPDHTFVGETTSVITPHGAPPITNIDESRGVWRLEGDIVSSEIQAVAFLSSTDPTVTRAIGQKILEDQIAKKAVYKSRILDVDGKVARSIPVDSMYKEAVVESTCRRV